jgi:hypothetical protein
MQDVVKPILDGKAENKAGFIKTALAPFEATLPKKPDAEPVGDAT